MNTPIEIARQRPSSLVGLLVVLLLLCVAAVISVLLTPAKKPSPVVAAPIAKHVPPPPIAAEPLSKIAPFPDAPAFTLGCDDPPAVPLREPPIAAIDRRDKYLEDVKTYHLFVDGQTLFWQLYRVDDGLQQMLAAEARKPMHTGPGLDLVYTPCYIAQVYETKLCPSKALHYLQECTKIFPYAPGPDRDMTSGFMPMYFGEVARMNDQLYRPIPLDLDEAVLRSLGNTTLDEPDAFLSARCVSDANRALHAQHDDQLRSSLVECIRASRERKHLDLLSGIPDAQR